MFFAFFLSAIAGVLLNLFCGSSLAQFVEIEPIGIPCEREACKTRDAIFFIHGIYGDDETFSNGGFDWPRELARNAAGRQIDVYRINYKTAFLDWARSNIATFDALSEALSRAIFGAPNVSDDPGADGLLVTRDDNVKRPYRSLNVIAHSLGGNVAAALVHDTKSLFGHDRRARFGFIVTLGTPAGGSQIANVGAILQALLQTNDGLLESLKRDNTFLRMLQRWRVAETAKARRFRCRPVHLYAGIEGQSTFGVPIVSEESADAPVRGLAADVRLFENKNHSSIAKPAGTSDPVYQWVSSILEREMARLDGWGDRALCTMPPAGAW